MRRFLCILIAFSCLFFCACDSDSEYPPVESTDEEARILFTLTSDDRNFDVRYELYRTFYLTLREDYPDGTLSLSDAEELEERIIDRISRFYAAFALAEEIDFDLNSDQVEERIQEYIQISVEGGYIDSAKIEGYESYDAYLASLTALYMNYSVQCEIFRYAIAQTEIDSYYKGTNGIAPNTTRENVRAFYDDADTGRYLMLYLDAAIFSDERANSIREKIAASTDEQGVRMEMIQYSTLAADDFSSGHVISAYSLDPLTYSNLTDAALSLSIGETSSVVRVINNANNGYFILYRTEKNETHFEEYYDDIQNEYLNDKIGRLLDDIVSDFKENIKYSAHYETLEREKISMEK